MGVRKGTSVELFHENKFRSHQNFRQSEAIGERTGCLEKEGSKLPGPPHPRFRDTVIIRVSRNV